MNRVIKLCKTYCDACRTFLTSTIGATTADVTAGFTATLIVTSIIVVSGNTLVMDIEEQAHIVNGNALVEAVKGTLSSDNTFPAIGANVEYTALQLKLDDRFSEILDPMGDGKEYDLATTKVKVVGSFTTQGSKQIYKPKFYVKLKSDSTAPAPNYVYLDQISASSPVRHSQVTRSHICHPKRDTAVCPQN